MGPSCGHENGSTLEPFRLHFFLSVITNFCFKCSSSSQTVLIIIRTLSLLPVYCNLDRKQIFLNKIRCYLTVFSLHPLPKTQARTQQDVVDLVRAHHTKERKGDIVEKLYLSLKTHQFQWQRSLPDHQGLLEDHLVQGPRDKLVHLVPLRVDPLPLDLLSTRSQDLGTPHSTD